MKRLTVRLPEALAANIEAESRERHVSKSDVVRERLERASGAAPDDPLTSIRDLIGSVDDDLPADLSARKKHYLKAMGYGRNLLADTGFLVAKLRQRAGPTDPQDCC